MNHIPCEFFLIRYVPNVATGEFVNIGVVLRETLPAEEVLVDARFSRQWDRVLRLDPYADIDLLQSLAVDISDRVRGESADDRGAESDGSIINLMRNSFSNSIQISEPHASLADNFASEMDRLMLMYVELPLEVGDGSGASRDHS